MSLGQRGKRLLIFWAVWTLLGLFFASKFYVETHTYGRGVPWTKALWWHLMEWYGWAAFSPAIFYICRKADADRERWWRLAALHFLVGSLISLLLVGVFSLGALVESRVLETGYSLGYLFKAQGLSF